MAFEIILSDEALSQLKKLDNATVKRILGRLKSARENPAHFFERLVGREEYKMKIGEYRIIAKIFYREERIFILSLGHRRNIYKKLK